MLTPEALAATLVSVLVLVLVGSTLHEKSLIRERGNPRYARASRWFALVSLPEVAGLVRVGAAGPWLLAPFVLLALRAHLLRKPQWRPVRIALVELGGLLPVAVGAFLVAPPRRSTKVLAGRRPLDADSGALEGAPWGIRMVRSRSGGVR